MRKTKVGLIDLSIDSFHPNKCIALLRGDRYRDRLELAYAWEEAPGKGRPLSQWCADNGVEPLASIQEVVNRSDAIAVFAPDNPERHPDLAEAALASGKPTFVDKTFAADVGSAKRMIALAETHKTPLFSGSALRFADEIYNWLANYKGDQRVTFFSTRGGEEWERYAIHQIEMALPLIGVGVRRVMQVGKGKAICMALDYDDDRAGLINCIKTTSPYNLNQGFEINVVMGDTMALSTGKLTSGTAFNRLAEAQAEFFMTGREPVPHEQILEGIRILRAGVQAMERPRTWVEVEA